MMPYVNAWTRLYRGILELVALLEKLGVIIPPQDNGLAEGRRKDRISNAQFLLIFSIMTYSIVYILATCLLHLNGSKL
jgi:hypothetical protein